MRYKRLERGRFILMTIVKHRWRTNLFARQIPDVTPHFSDAQHGSGRRNDSTVAQALIRGLSTPGQQFVEAVDRTGDQPRERAPRHEVHQLSEQRLAGVHAQLPWKSPPEPAPARSNRHHQSEAKKLRKTKT